MAIGQQFTSVDLSQSKYDFKYLVFPNDLGISDNGHYMVININAPTKIDGEYAGRFTNFYEQLPNTERSKVDRLRYRDYTGGIPFRPVLGAGNEGDRPAASIPRQTRRVAESIALHMPTPLVFNNQNVYEEISLTALGAKLMVGTSSLLGAFARGLSESFNRGLGRAVSNILSGAGQLAGTASKLLQSPINPMVEILFTNTVVRSFALELLMAPRNEEESENIKAIIKTLRFHAAPEYGYDSSTGIIPDGLFWIPPAEFDITFFNKGVENTNILRINTCVLERVEVDYAPQGVYSTFRNGHPVATRLSMAFRELEPVHKKRVLEGF